MNLVDRSRRKEETLSDAEIVKIVNDNHIWINALLLVNPDDKIKIQIGESVIAMLKESRIADDLSGSLPLAYIRVNAS